MEILRYLVEHNILTEQQAQQIQKEALEAEKKPEEVIMEKELVDEKHLFQVKSEMLNMPLRTVNVDEVPLKALEQISEESAKYYQMVPLGMDERGALEVGMVYPKDIKAQGALKFLSRQGDFSYKISLITPTLFESLMRKYRNMKGEVKMALEELEQEVKTQGKAAKSRKSAELQRVTEEAPITKMVGVFVRNAVEGGASDIHIEPSRDKLRIRFRFMGDLFSSLFLPMNAHAAIVARIKILSNLKIDETRVPQDGRFSMVIDDRTIDFRVATLPTSIGEKVAIRILDPEGAQQNFEDLGLEGINLQKVSEAIKQPFGLILVTGPTGSGKTTTLYTILRKLNQETVNIVSLEDPVEYIIDGVNQSQVKPEIGYDFAQGLRQILRQDPDIIMVGEVRDDETASLVVHAALTGHLVLSTLHTNNAFGIIPRLVDMGVEKYLIPVTLNVGIAQRLVRKLCQSCREPKKANTAMRELIKKQVDNAPPQYKKRLATQLTKMTLYDPKGCKDCGSSGFSGRIGVYEVLWMTDEIAAVITADPSEAKLAEAAKKQGMITMFQDGVAKALDGVTTMEEVIRVAEE